VSDLEYVDDDNDSVPSERKVDSSDDKVEFNDNLPDSDSGDVKAEEGSYGHVSHDVDSIYVEEDHPECHNGIYSGEEEDDASNEGGHILAIWVLKEAKLLESRISCQITMLYVMSQWPRNAQSPSFPW
jgi:hypothetical protein